MLSVVKEGGGGPCLFRCLSRQTTGTPAHWRLVRRALIDFLMQPPDPFKETLELLSPGMDLEAHIADLCANESEWGELLDVFAASALFNRPFFFLVSPVADPDFKVPDADTLVETWAPLSCGMPVPSELAALLVGDLKNAPFRLINWWSWHYDTISPASQQALLPVFPEAARRTQENVDACRAPTPTDFVFIWRNYVGRPLAATDGVRRLRAAAEEHVPWAFRREFEVRLVLISAEEEGPGGGGVDGKGCAALDDAAAAAGAGVAEQERGGNLRHTPVQDGDSVFVFIGGRPLVIENVAEGRGEEEKEEEEEEESCDKEGAVVVVAVGVEAAAGGEGGGGGRGVPTSVNKAAPQGSVFTVRVLGCDKSVREGQHVNLTVKGAGGDGELALDALSGAMKARVCPLEDGWKELSIYVDVVRAPPKGVAGGDVSCEGGKGGAAGDIKAETDGGE